MSAGDTSQWSFGRALGSIAHGADGRLVVIDTEDAEQVARIIDDYDARRGVTLAGTGRDRENRVAQFQAALRSLITPPKPEEPTGLGAVVEDAEGVRWVRTGQGRYPWSDAPAPDEQGDTTWESCTYADIAAVEILSEGVR